MFENIRKEIAVVVLSAASLISSGCSNNESATDEVVAQGRIGNSQNSAEFVSTEGVSYDWPQEVIKVTKIPTDRVDEYMAVLKTGDLLEGILHTDNLDDIFYARAELSNHLPQTIECIKLANIDSEQGNGESFARLIENLTTIKDRLDSPNVPDFKISFRELSEGTIEQLRNFAFSLTIKE